MGSKHSSEVRGLAYGKGQIVAVAAVGGRGIEIDRLTMLPLSTIQTSTDGGANWIEQPSGTVTNYWFFGVTYADGQFVAVR
jgi:hypothetical protein